MNIHPIKTKADYEAALTEVELLFNAKPNTPKGEHLDILITLIQAYEENHYLIAAPDPIDAIQYYMESCGLDRKDLECHIGSRAKVSEVLNRKRPLSLNMIRRLYAAFKIPLEALITPLKHHAG